MWWCVVQEGEGRRGRKRGRGQQAQEEPEEPEGEEAPANGVCVGGSCLRELLLCASHLAAHTPIEQQNRSH